MASVGASEQQCNIFLVRNDAPKFETGQDTVKWMEGKQTSAPQGACADRFAREAFDQLGVKPAS